MNAQPQGRKLVAQTLAYFTPGEGGMHISAFPEINGMHCYKWSASDVFEERDTAFTLLAKIAEGRIDGFDADDAAREFFKDQGEEPWNYLEDEEEEDEEDG